MARLNYGTMPTLGYFRLRYELTMLEQYGPEQPGSLRAKPYDIHHGTGDREYRPRMRSYTCDELYAECVRLMGRYDAMTDMGGDEPSAWVSDILGSLGIEWV